MRSKFVPLAVPLSCDTTAGGDTVVWVGFELQRRSRQLGNSDRKAEWFVRRTQEIAAAERVVFRREAGAYYERHWRPRAWGAFLGSLVQVHGDESQSFHSSCSLACLLHPQFLIPASPGFAVQFMCYVHLCIIHGDSSGPTGQWWAHGIWWMVPNP